MKKEADWVLRHFPFPYELAFSEHNAELLEKPEIHYPADSQKQYTVGDVVMLLERLDPSMRIVVDGYQGGFEDLRTIELVPIEVEANADRDSFGPYQLDTSDNAEQALLLAGLTPRGLKPSDSPD